MYSRYKTGMAAALRTVGFKCPYCPDEYIIATEVLLQTHIRIVHSSDPGFSIRCSVEGCERTFSNFRTYQNHLLSPLPDLADEEHDEESNIEETETSECGTCTAKPSSRGSYAPSLPKSEDMKMYCAKWLLKTSETRTLTRAVSVGIVEDVLSLIEFVTNGIKSEIANLLTSNQIDNNVILKVKELFTNPTLVPFVGLSTFYQQMQYYKDNFNLIVSLS